MITLIKADLFKQGGLEKYTWKIAQDFCALKVPVRVLTTGPTQAPFVDPHLQIISFPIRHSLSFLNVLHFDKACTEFLAHHPTPIVFSLDRTRFQTHMRAGNGVHAAYLERRSQEEGFFKRLTFTLNPLHRLLLSLEKKGFEHPRLKTLFTNSNMVKQEIVEFYRIDPNKICVVHNGVEWAPMQECFDAWESKRESTLKALNLDSSAFQFLFIGHNFRRKGLNKLLQALALLKGEHFQLSVVGKDKHLPYFETLVQRLGLTKKVYFFGPQKDTIPFYQMADCLVIPSLYDPFANVTVEALAMGLFTLSSKNNGGHEVLTPQNGALITSLDDLQGFAKTLKEAMTRSKTNGSARAIRQSVKHLDFSNQLRLITEQTLAASLR